MPNVKMIFTITAISTNIYPPYYINFSRYALCYDLIQLTKLLYPVYNNHSVESALISVYLSGKSKTNANVSPTKKNRGEFTLVPVGETVRKLHDMHEKHTLL